MVLTAGEKDRSCGFSEVLFDVLVLRPGVGMKDLRRLPQANEGSPFLVCSVITKPITVTISYSKKLVKCVVIVALYSQTSIKRRCLKVPMIPNTILHT